MFIRNALLAGAMAVALPSAALATPSVNLGGISIPIGTIGHADGSVVVDLGAGIDTTAAIPDLSNISVFGRVQAIGVSDGFGDIDAGTTTYQSDTLNPANVELTYLLQLTGFSLAPTASGFDLTVDSGFVTYYVDVFGDFDGSDPLSASNGTPWLVADLVVPETFSIDIFNGAVAADNDGLLFDVRDIAGTFFENFDTNAFDGGSDIFTFSLLANGGDFDLDLSTGLLTGSTGGSTDTEFRAISEPATVGLLGLGLVGLGFAGRRRAA